MQERIGKHLPGVTAVLSLIPLPAFTAGASPESGEYRGGEESGQHNGGGRERSVVAVQGNTGAVEQFSGNTGKGRGNQEE